MPLLKQRYCRIKNLNVHAKALLVQLVYLNERLLPPKASAVKGEVLLAAVIM